MKTERETTHPAFMDLPHDYPNMEPPRMGSSSLDDRVATFTEQVKTAQIQWSDPEPLQETLKPVQEFRTQLLPNNCAGFVKDIAHRMQAPPDFAAAPFNGCPFLIDWPQVWHLSKKER